jgi:head-tail adaptor
MGAIGKMDRRIEVVAPASGKTPMGGAQKAFSHLFFAWASRELVTEGEDVVNRRLVVNARYRYLTHRRGGIDESRQLIDQGITYNILAVEPTENKMFIEILAEKIVE